MDHTENLTISREAALYEACLPVTATANEILATMRKHGIAILPRYFSDETVTALNEEFDRMLERARALDST